MSTAVLEKVNEVVETEADDEEMVNHILCHCRIDRAWCGVELNVVIGEVADPDDEDCAECSAMALAYVDECPYGCNCTPNMRMLNCVGDEEDEDE